LLVGVGDRLRVHRHAACILDQQRRAEALADHRGDVLPAGLGKLDGFWQPIVVGCPAVPVQDMQVCADPGSDDAVAGGKPRAGTQRVFPLLRAVRVEAEQGRPVVIQNLVPEGRDLLRYDAAQFADSQPAGSAAKGAQHVQEKQRRDQNRRHRKQKPETVAAFAAALHESPPRMKSRGL